MKVTLPKINPELQAFLPAASDDLKLALKEKLFRDGVLEPILIAEDGDIVDGYTRYAIYKEQGILKYPVKVVPGINTLDEKKAWMRDHQIARRNLTTSEWKYFWGLKFNEEKLPDGNPSLQLHQNDGVGNQQKIQGETAERIAEESGKSAATVERAGRFATAVEKQPKSVRPALIGGSLPAELVIEANGRDLFCQICIRRGIRRGCEQCKKWQDKISGPKPRSKKKPTKSIFDNRDKELNPLHEQLIEAVSTLPGPLKKDVAEWRRGIGVLIEKIEIILLEKQ